MGDIVYIRLPCGQCQQSTAFRPDEVTVLLDALDVPVRWRFPCGQCDRWSYRHATLDDLTAILPLGVDSLPVDADPMHPGMPLAFTEREIVDFVAGLTEADIIAATWSGKGYQRPGPADGAQ